MAVHYLTTTGEPPRRTPRGASCNPDPSPSRPYYNVTMHAPGPITLACCTPGPLAPAIVCIHDCPACAAACTTCHPPPAPHASKATPPSPKSSPPAPKPAPPPPSAGAGLHPRATLLAPASATTVVHLLDRGFKPWAAPYTQFDFSLHQVPVAVTLEALVGVVYPAGDKGAKENGVVEAIEVGDGTWIRGSAFKAGEEASKQTLEKVGWSASRGRGRKPVWLCWG
jgi:hypothetical protein